MSDPRSTGGYSASSYGGKGKRSVCMFPGCRVLSVTEVRRPIPTGDSSWVCLCTTHRSSYDCMSLRDIELLPWDERIHRTHLNVSQNR